jgi:class 3 adenylate cyclase
MSDERAAERGLEMAYVLFMDMVGYSTLPMDVQSRLIDQLQNIVRSTPQYLRAQHNDQLIALPTGDGMALVFFQDPIAPVQCAIEITRALQEQSGLNLRMGINMGPVYRIADINANRNVSGGGINLAQRVMDCGDAGHILLSKSVADLLAQLSEWSSWLQDLGEVEVKHGSRIHVVNLYMGQAGNPNVPSTLRARSVHRQETRQ